MSFKRIESYVQEAPVFRPALTEWTELDPIQYIEEVVRPVAEKAGICKIIPPKGWAPSTQVEKTRYKFPTRIQVTNSLEAKARVRSYFCDTVRKLSFLHGRPLRRPSASHRPDWYSLFKEVMRRGGLKKVTAKDEWADVKNALQNDAVFTPMSPTKLADVYHDVLLDLEDFVSEKDVQMTPVGKAAARPGSVSSSSSNTQSPAKKPSAKRSNLFESPVKKLRLDTLGNSSRSQQVEALLRMCETVPNAPRVNQKFWKWYPDRRECLQGHVQKQGTGSKAMWTVRYESSKRDEFFVDEESSDDLALAIACGSSASEAKDAQEIGVCQCCNRGHNQDSILECDSCEWRFHEACLPDQCRSYGRRELDWYCPMCLDKFLKNETKDAAGADLEHDASLDALRVGTRFAPTTLAAGVHELAAFGFADGEKCTQEEFIAKDERFCSDYIARSGQNVFQSERATEEEFWRIVRGDVQFPVSVHYGNDLDTSMIGSGFPTLERLDKRKKALERLSENQRAALIAFATSPWNLNNFPTSTGSLLSLLGSNISGVIVPWLYLGMTFSAFCFHVEDHNFASINYLHSGKPKSWWGIPASHADRFEAAAREICPELFEVRPDLLQLILTMFDPHEMAAKGVAMYHTVQREGEFVVTFPRAYHGGFNHGVNAAEAVNFASKSWLPFGQQAVERLSLLRRAPVVAHESMLIAIASWCAEEDVSRKDEDLVLKTAFKVLPALMAMLKAENQARASAMKTKKRHFIMFTESRRGSMAARERQYRMGRVQGLAGFYEGVPSCSVCKRYCSLSHARSVDGIVTCLEHAAPSAILYQTYQLEGLEDLVTQLAEKTRVPCIWVERALRLCWGVKQPDAALGKDCMGGPPLQSSDLGAEAICNPGIFGNPAQWKVKPRLPHVRKLLEISGAHLVDEARVLRRMLERAEVLKERCALALRGDGHARQISIEELGELHAKVQACPFALEGEASTQISSLLAEVTRFRKSAAEVLVKTSEQAADAIEQLLITFARLQDKVAIPEFSVLEKRLVSLRVRSLPPSHRRGALHAS